MSEENGVLGLERLMHKEIIYAHGAISYEKVNCILEAVVAKVQKCSRASYREESSYYTSNEENSTEELKKATSTTSLSDISEISDNCKNIQILDKKDRDTKSINNYKEIF